MLQPHEVYRLFQMPIVLWRKHVLRQSFQEKKISSMLVVLVS